MKIFLNYRRDDSEGWADRVHDGLRERFDEVFLDVDGKIPFGLPWAQWLDDQVKDCDALVALIGRRWAESFEAKAAAGEPDFVKTEIESALARGVPAAAVLLGDTPLPDAARLPEGVRPLFANQAARLRRGPDFAGDMARLNAGLAAAIELHRKTAPARTGGADADRAAVEPQARPRAAAPVVGRARDAAPTPAFTGVLQGHTGPVRSVALTPDGTRALSGSWDGTVRVWDITG